MLRAMWLIVRGHGWTSLRQQQDKCGLLYDILGHCWTWALTRPDSQGVTVTRRS